MTEGSRDEVFGRIILTIGLVAWLVAPLGVAASHGAAQIIASLTNDDHTVGAAPHAEAPAPVLHDATDHDHPLLAILADRQASLRLPMPLPLPRVGQPVMARTPERPRRPPRDLAV